MTILLSALSLNSVIDIATIYSYIAFELLVPGISESQVNRIRKPIHSRDLCHHEILSFYNFLVFYTLDDVDLTVIIIRIVYGDQDMQAITSQTYNG